jgi:hypothetical protein
MFPVDAVFSHCRFVWLTQTNVPVVFLDPGINRTASLPNVNLTALAWYAVDIAHCEHHIPRQRSPLKTGPLERVKEGGT